MLFKKGQRLGVKNLGALMRERHDDLRRNVLASISKREKRSVPLDDGDGPLTDPGPYIGDPWWDTLWVEFRAMSTRDYRAAQLAMQLVEGDPVAEDVEKLEVVRLALAGVSETEKMSDGLTVAGRDPLVVDGEPSSEQLADLADNDLADVLFWAALHSHRLKEEERKNSGASRRSISATSIATHAPPTSASSEDATAELAPPSLRASNEASSSLTPAPAGSCETALSSTQSLASSSTSTTGGSASPN